MFGLLLSCLGGWCIVWRGLCCGVAVVGRLLLLACAFISHVLWWSPAGSHPWLPTLLPCAVLSWGCDAKQVGRPR